MFGKIVHKYCSGRPDSGWTVKVRTELWGRTLPELESGHRRRRRCRPRMRTKMCNGFMYISSAASTQKATTKRQENTDVCFVIYGTWQAAQGFGLHSPPPDRCDVGREHAGMIKDGTTGRGKVVHVKIFIISISSPNRGSKNCTEKIAILILIIYRELPYWQREWREAGSKPTDCVGIGRHCWCLFPRIFAWLSRTPENCGRPTRPNVLRFAGSTPRGHCKEAHRKGSGSRMKISSSVVYTQMLYL